MHVWKVLISSKPDSDTLSLHQGLAPGLQDFQEMVMETLGYNTEKGHPHDFVLSAVCPDRLLLTRKGCMEKALHEAVTV